MENEYKAIEEFSFSLITDFFKLIPRQGPGSREVTLKALSFIDNLDEGSKIADIGCGIGTQTLTLAKNTTGSIVAVDLLSPFLKILNEKVEAQGLANRFKTLECSMDNLPFREEEFDLIWSEGAIYNLGFENGINQWRKYIKKGGYLAVSETVWLTRERPQEITDFWNFHYPEVSMPSVFMEKLEKAGYTPVGYFNLPQRCWLDNFYYKMDPIYETFLVSKDYHPDAVVFVDEMKKEAEIYKKYKDFYTYGFFIAKKI